MSPVNDRIRSWWTDDPEDPGRPKASNPDVIELIGRLSPGGSALDLGGTMSLNVLVIPDNIVVRVHQPFVTRQRIAFEQSLRVLVSGNSIVTACPIEFGGVAVFRCGRRLAEAEPFVEHVKPTQSIDSYEWLYTNMAYLHKMLQPFNDKVVSSLAAIWAPPSSLRRWSSITERALSEFTDGRKVAHRLHSLVNFVRRSWIPPSRLHCQMTHGDFRLGNVCSMPDDGTLVLDFGFADWRLRLHDIAYTMVFMFLGPNRSDWTGDTIRMALESYDSASPVRLSREKIAAIPAYSVSVMLHALAHDGCTADPVASLAQRIPFLECAEWFEQHAVEIRGSLR